MVKQIKDIRRGYENKLNGNKRIINTYNILKW